MARQRRIESRQERYFREGIPHTTSPGTESCLYISMGDTQPAAIDKVENTALASPLYTLIKVLQRFQFESIRPYCPIALLLFKTRLFPAR